MCVRTEKLEIFILQGIILTLNTAPCIQHLFYQRADVMLLVTRLFLYEVVVYRI